ncbi:tyrosine-type recombinase/integrase [Spirosoma sp. KNUC1025]|uniref:tyrosine-type recombinase/integrase n=1 Tax=Spirosoma sp. KNUC1025 TaxID=2894082 RepID=UPI0038662A37|nr:site-specific integrase [Spirosoma sp. KNUC1025]
MALSLKIILHSKIYHDGTQPVMLQCIVSSPTGTIWKRRMICKVKSTQFDKATGRVKKNHPNQTYLNVKIAEAYNEAQKRLLDTEQRGFKPDPAYILATGVATTSQAGKLLVHGRAYIVACQQKGQYHTALKYAGHLNRLAAYLGKTNTGEQIDIYLDDVDETWILAWSVWLKKNGTKSANTLHRRMAFITTLFNDARKRGLTKADSMAFLEFKEQRVRKPKLTIEQLDALQEMQLTGLQADARNTFMLQFFAYGTRISDALNWKKSDVRQETDAWYLSYTSMKTGDLIDVRLNPKAKELIASYLETVPGEFLLPWLSKFIPNPVLTDQENKGRLIEKIESQTALINKYLKAIAQKLGFPHKLTTHIARHTFATLADSRISDKRKISAALGHSRFATTEVYLSELRQSDVNDAMEAVWQ